MNLEELRLKIDKADDALIRAFCERMQVSADIAAYKKEHGLPILDSSRERRKLKDVAEKAGTEMEDYATVLYELLFELSRAYQGHLSDEATELTHEIEAAISGTPSLFPPKAQVACQGVEGAYSQAACEKLFRSPSISYFSTFDAVFSAIENGFCQYGVIPLENSTAGSVNTVYDLMIRHNFYVARSVRIKVDHNLVAKKGTKLSDIREIVSHEQALNQCSSFLSTLKGVKITSCANTAEAAKLVAESGRTDLAALCSRNCLELYDLSCIKASVQNRNNNYTRFICISKNLQIFPGADRTSMMMILPHRAGSLYKVLARFYAMNINLIKLESRPLPERDFEFMFYFDLETSIYSPEFTQLMGELQTISEEFKYLGSYSEVI